MKGTPGLIKALGVWLGMMALWPATMEAGERPNILVILTDDMGFSDLGCFGSEIETPHLDSLAKGGLRFTEFYNNARCWPTRATLLSGRYSEGLSKEQVTIPEVLKGAGYETGMVGKWHLGNDARKNGPVQRGFDRFYGTLAGANSYWDPESLTRGVEAAVPVGEGYYYTDQIGVEAAAQISGFAKTKEPFFQYVAFTAAHWPLHAPEATIQKYLERYRGGWEKMRMERYARMIEMGVIDAKRWPLPAPEKRVEDWESADHKEWRIRNQAIYAAMVDHMDQAVGRIIAALKMTGQFENTLIVYAHDNGACSEHLRGNAWNTANMVLEKAKKEGETVAVGDVYEVPMGGPLTFGSVGHDWANAQNTPMRRYKANVYNGGACTPAIMHWPVGIKAKGGSISAGRGHVVDLMATCLELAGASYPGSFGGQKILPSDSYSLVPLLQGGAGDRDHPYFFDHSGTQAIVKGDYKMVREGKGDWALYDLAKERTEITDLVGRHPEIVAELAAIWAAWRSEPGR